MSHSRSYDDGKTCARLHFKIPSVGRYKKFTLTSLNAIEAINSSFTHPPRNRKLLVSLNEYRVLEVSFRVLVILWRTMKLTNEQIAEFNTNGFLLLKNFADPKLCDAILEKAQEHLDKQIAPIESEEEYLRSGVSTSTIRRLRQVYDREEVFREWMQNKEILPILEQLLGKSPKLLLAHHNSIMTKLPHKSSITTWHQDIRYWHYENDELLSVWLSLGDEFLENGLLEFIPGSHKMNFTMEQFDERSSFKEDTNENKAITAKRVHFNLEKGDIVLFHAKTLHYAHQNETDKAKISFVYSLRAANNLPIKNTRSEFKEISL